MEDWLSSITRVGFTSGDGEGDSGAMAGLIDHLGAQVDVLQTIAAQGEYSRQALEERLATLDATLAHMAAQSEVALSQTADQTAVLARIAEGQERLIAALVAAAKDPEVVEHFTKSGIEVRSLAGDAFAARVKREIDELRELNKDLKLTLE